MQVLKNENDMSETADQLKARFTTGKTVTSESMNAMVDALAVSSTTKETLKSYFETGDKPTQAQFYELIDAIFEQQGTWYPGGYSYIQVKQSWTGGPLTSNEAVNVGATNSPYILSTTTPLGTSYYRAIKVNATIKSQTGTSFTDEVVYQVANPKPTGTMLWPSSLAASTSTDPIVITTAIYTSIDASIGFLLYIRIWLGLYLNSSGQYQLSAIIRPNWFSNTNTMPVVIQSYNQLNFAVALDFYYQNTMVS